jgi:NADH:ubiquinone oxidoreductase subunit 2 (subunit N)
MDFLTLREVFYFSNSKEPRALILLFFFLFSFGVFFKLSVFPFHL